uniref:NADH dehydrogenase [ubiquinone] 1 beta subcomplex subunit 11, mitochondrial n=1 Tax=Corethron hystrix TaxID=216773 RepID=A0A7S1FM80_9STRA|mmetsp:Transcript_15474/g.34754  ORF Transcript_15474/g.34754 Transcript_15474/m.34754 type:complete len:179 (+) Transcript_15474:32-568(+)
MEGARNSRPPSPISSASMPLLRPASRLLSLSRFRPLSPPLRRSFGVGPPVAQSNKAQLFGGPSYEGWEPIVYATYAAAAVILGVGVGFQPDTNIQTWDRHEAGARLALKEAGAVTEVEFGIHYDDPGRKFRFYIDDSEDLDEDDDGMEMMPVTDFGKKKKKAAAEEEEDEDEDEEEDE